MRESFLVQLYPLMAVGGLSSSGSGDSDGVIVTSMRTELIRLLKERHQVTESDQHAPLNYLPGVSGRRVLFRYRLLDKIHAVQPQFASPNSGKRFNSLLSPGNPQSPLYPDGLMHENWIEKYRSELPAVISMFYVLGSSSSDDQRLIERISNDRRTLLPAGIETGGGVPLKFVVVLLVPPGIGIQEDRLAMLRKSCALDSRHGLFTLLTGTDIGDFISSFERLMHEYALNFYRECGKRQKKKKSKLPSSSTSAIASVKSNAAAAGSTLSVPAALSPAGWSVRYEFKMAVFAEIIQDFDLATKYYITVYNSLLQLFSETVAAADGKTMLKLQPFSPRWQEAIRLADCLSYKISKFLMFGESPINSLLQLNRHINLFHEIRRTISSTIGGPGSDCALNSFEYWDWLSQQYRLFADVLTIALNHGVRLPGPDILSAASADVNYLKSQSPISRLFSSPSFPALVEPSPTASAVKGTAGSSVGLVSLLTPGFYYLKAAQCTAKQLLSASALQLTGGGGGGGETLAAILTRERLMPSDRQAAQSECNQQTIDLCTRAYEQFKKHQHHRMALRAAMLIADTYLAKGNAETAVKKEHQWSLLIPVLRKLSQCADQAKDLVTQLRTLAELLAMTASSLSGKNDKDLVELFVRLRELAEAYSKSSASVELVQLTTGSHVPFVKADCRFGRERMFARETANLEIRLSGKAPLAACFHLNGLRINFTSSNSSLRSIQIKHQAIQGGGGERDDDQVQMAATISGEEHAYTANLTICSNKCSVINLPISIDSPQEIKIDRVDLLLNDFVQLSISAVNYKGSVALDSGKILKVEAIQPRFVVDCSLESNQVLLDEYFPLTVQLRNDESWAMHAWLSVACRGISGNGVNTESSAQNSTEIDINSHAVDTVMFPGEGEEKEKEEELLSINRFDMGIIDSRSTVARNLFLRCRKNIGTRILLITVHFQRSDAEAKNGDDNKNPTGILTKELRLFVAKPFEHLFEISRHDRLLKPQSTSPDVSNGSRALMNHQVLLQAEHNSLVQMDLTVTVSVKNHSAFDLMISKCDFIPTVQQEDLVKKSLVAKPLMDDDPHLLPAGMSSQILFQLKVAWDLLEHPEFVDLGKLQFEWERSAFAADGKIHRKTCNQFPLPQVKLAGDALTTMGLHVDHDLPNQIYLDKPFCVRYSITNLSPTKHQDLIATMDIGDGFVFAGYKQMAVRALPLSKTLLEYRLWPLKSGPLYLPHFHIFSKPNSMAGREPKELLNTIKPIRVFVHPTQNNK